MTSRRHQNKQEQRRTVLLQCEGQKTEFHYLDALRRDERFREVYAVTPKPGKGLNAVVTLELAIAERDRLRDRGEPYDEIWCVLDVEHAAHAATLDQALQIAQNEDFTIFLSNPCFEVWLLAHFERKAPFLQNCDAAVTRLTEKYWKPTFGTDYGKGDERLYAKLASRVSHALTNSQWVLEGHHSGGPCRDCNSSTEVYQLIRRLLPPDEPPN